MQISFSQRWAVGAITLATLIACSPPVQVLTGTPASTAPASATTAVEPATALQADAVNPTPAPGDPGYAGAWAETTADCSDPAKTFLFSAEVVNLTPQKRNCAVKSMREERPTGRSAIYTLVAACISDPPGAAGGKDTLVLNFGASDTVMQLEVNSDPPLRLERCATNAKP